MTTEKKALMCVFRPKKLKSTDEMREWFTGSYDRFMEMDSVEFKCWWVDQEKGEWGSLYVFTSEDALNAYVASDVWLKVVPEKYGCTPEWRVVEPGPIIAKTTLTEAAGSWLASE